MKVFGDIGGSNAARIRSIPSDVKDNCNSCFDHYNDAQHKQITALRSKTPLSRTHSDPIHRRLRPIYQSFELIKHNINKSYEGFSYQSMTYINSDADTVEGDIDGHGNHRPSKIKLKRSARRKEQSSAASDKVSLTSYSTTEKPITEFDCGSNLKKIRLRRTSSTPAEQLGVFLGPNSRKLGNAPENAELKIIYSDILVSKRGVGSDLRQDTHDLGNGTDSNSTRSTSNNSVAFYPDDSLKKEDVITREPISIQTELQGTLQVTDTSSLTPSKKLTGSSYQMQQKSYDKGYPNDSFAIQNVQHNRHDGCLSCLRTTHDVIRCCSCMVLADAICYHCTEDDIGYNDWWGDMFKCRYSARVNCQKWTMFVAGLAFLPCLWLYPLFGWPISLCINCEQKMVQKSSG